MLTSMETLPVPAPPTLTVPAVRVLTPEITGRFSVGLPVDRDITAQEAGEAIQRVLDFYDDSNLAQAMMRWTIGRIFAATDSASCGWRDVLANVNRAIGEDYGKSFLYECRAFYLSQPDMMRAEAKVQAFIEEGYYSWTGYRDKYLRPEREAQKDGETLAEIAAPKLAKAERLLAAGEKEMEEIVEMLPQDHELRDTAEVLLKQAQDYRAQEVPEVAHGVIDAQERGPWRSEAYLDFVRGFCCPWTGSPEVDAAHVLGQRGMAQKGSDALTVPQSHDLHMGLHAEDAHWIAQHEAGPTDAEVAASLLSYFVTGRNDGPVRLTPNR